MKRDPIGRSVVRYFKDAATSAWGKLSRTHDPGRDPDGYALTARPGLFGFLKPSLEYVGRPWSPPDAAILGRGSDPVPVAYFLDGAGDLYATNGHDVPERLTSNPEALRAALREVDDLIPPQLTWSAWSEMQREIDRPGWSFCRLGIRTPSGGVGQVFGYVRDGFGMYGKNYHVCGSISGVRQLWSLVHLRSGLGLGLFATPSEAGEAGDIAIRLGIDDPSEDGIVHHDWLRLRSAWRAASFDIGSDYAHQVVNGVIVPGELNIWQYDIMSDITARPDKLS